MRLTRGGGRAGLVRLLSMSLGVAIAVLTALLAWAIPHSLAGATHRAAARWPAAVTERSAATFGYATVDDSVGTRPMSRILLAPIRIGAPPPPGCTTFPETGRSCASPALARLASGDAALTARLGGKPTELIAPGGLASPDELVIYQGVAADRVADLSFAHGWETQRGSAPPVVSPATVAGEVGLLVGAPAVCLIGVCARLSAATRARRAHVLSLVGMSTQEIGFYAAFDGRLAGLAGAGIGIVAFDLTQPALARSGLVGGYEWWPQDCRLSVPAAIITVLGAALVAGRLSRLGLRAAMRGPAARRSPSLWRLAPLWVGTLILTYFLIMSNGGRRLPTRTVLVLSGGSLICIGLLLAMRPIVFSIAHMLSDRTLMLRLACRRLQWEPSSAERVLVGLVLLVLVATVGSSVLRDARLAAGPPRQDQVITVDASVVRPGSRPGLADLPARIAFGSVMTDSELTDGTALSADLGEASAQLGVTISYLTCSTLTDLLAGSELPCLNDTAYRVSGSFPNPLRPGRRLHLTTQAGTTTITVPEATLDVGPHVLDPGSILITTSKPTFSWPAATTFTYIVTADSGSVARFQEALAQLSPAALAFLQSANLPAMRVYRIHQGVITWSTSIGFLLGLCAFVVASADAHRERRRSVSKLLAIGCSRRTIRGTQALQLGIPASALIALSVAAGHLVGTAYLVGSGLQHGWYAASLVDGLVLAGAAVVAALGAGWLLPVSSPRPEELRAE